MRRFDNRLIWGVLLIVGGVLFLLQNLGLFPIIDFIWAFLLGAVGIGFLAVVISNRQHWWAVIPGLILTYLAGLIVMSHLVPAFANDFGGALLLGVIGLSFWIIYALNPQFWWAIIPAGVMITIGLITGAERYVNGIETGGIFLIGIGLTFGLLALVRVPTVGRMRWPLIPAIILIAIGTFVAFSATSYFGVIWPIALIILGLYIFFSRIPARR